jgi:hypothetical protein
MATSPGLAWFLANGRSQEEFDKSILDAIKQGEAQKLSDAQFKAQMNQWGISPADVARVTGLTTQDVQARFDAATATTPEEIAYNQKAMDELAMREAQSIAQQKIDADKLVAQQAGLLAPTGATSVTGTTPFANATQGFAQNLNNYTSIPIGSQYNPNVVGGTGSPYAQIMGQMKPFANPYAGVVAGQALGGYNPALYDQIAAANAARTAAEAAAAANTNVNLSGGGGDGNSTSAGEGPGGNSGGGEGNGATAGEAGAGYAMGGMVSSLLGPNPPGADDGMAGLDRGEYVIKKSSVNKYGRGLLDMINEGKVPAKKMKSLLG